MRLWTVHPTPVWDELRTNGVVHVDPFRVNAEGWIHPQYAWLSFQLRHRINIPRGRLPWFAYCERPDLRSMRHFRPKDSQEVLIEFEPAAQSFVAFPVWAWSEVFCGQYLSFTRAQAVDWQNQVKRDTGRSFDDYEGRLPQPLHRKLEKSWTRLFSADLPQRSWRRGERSRAREAVVAQLLIEWVHCVKHFVGTNQALKQAPPV